ncbi:MAG: ATP-binding cassette domain-containing protein [Bacteroidota bacterium]
MGTAEITNGIAQDAVIEISHLTKSFNGRPVLRDINMLLHRGENLAVLGKSGQGKSVTIKCIIGLIEQDGGVVKVLGKDVIALEDDALKELRVKVGFLFQGGALYDSMSVEENLAFPLTRVLKLTNRKEIRQRVHEILEEVELKQTAKKMPSELSGGMRKRIALARTLIMKPEIILYDEPTTGLDPITSKDISELIRKMQEKYKASSLIITHDMACARITADRMLVMNDGVFIAEGTHEELAKCDNEMVCAFFK